MTVEKLDQLRQSCFCTSLRGSSRTTLSKMWSSTRVVLVLVVVVVVVVRPPTTQARGRDADYYLSRWSSKQTTQGKDLPDPSEDDLQPIPAHPTSRLPLRAAESDVLAIRGGADTQILPRLSSSANVSADDATADDRNSRCKCLYCPGRLSLALSSSKR